MTETMTPVESAVFDALADAADPYDSGIAVEDFIKALDAAGYVIVPKEPAEADIKRVATAIAQSRSPDAKPTHCMIDATVACAEYARGASSHD